MCVCTSVVLLVPLMANRDNDQHPVTKTFGFKRERQCFSLAADEICRLPLAGWRGKSLSQKAMLMFCYCHGNVERRWHFLRGWGGGTGSLEVGAACRWLRLTWRPPPLHLPSWSFIHVTRLISPISSAVSPLLSSAPTHSSVFALSRSPSLLPSPKMIGRSLGPKRLDGSVP